MDMRVRNSKWKTHENIENRLVLFSSITPYLNSYNSLMGRVSKRSMNTLHPSSVTTVVFPQCGDFHSAFGQLLSSQRVSALWKRPAPDARGLPAKLSPWQLLGSLVWHVLARTRHLSHHVREMCAVKLSDSALSQRRQHAGFTVFAALLEAALRPLAELARQPGAFHQGLRLVALDATHWNVSNTPRLLRALPKAATRRLRAAFGKLRAAVLIEVGLHNPLAAELGLAQEGELTLARRLFALVPPNALLLADRLYGSYVVAWELTAALKDKGSHFLVRVSRVCKPKTLEVLGDGSRIIAVRAPAGGPVLRLREVRGKVRRAGRSWAHLRLWTTLLDAKTHSAETLLRLYAQRWEHELFFKELKLEVGGSDLLASHTLETAAQEVAALLMAAALVARQRQEVAEAAQVDAVRVSFGQVLEATRALWSVLALGLGTGILSRAQGRDLVQAQLRELGHSAILPPRRVRSCPRELRQPVSGWPRKLKNHSFETKELIIKVSMEKQT